MLIENRTKTITNTYTVYIALDGKEFDDEKKCIEYEKKLDKLDNAISSLRIYEYNNYLPITNSDEWRDCDVHWFRVNNEDDYAAIYDYYDSHSTTDYFREPTSYPTLMCVIDYYDYGDVYYMSEIIETVKLFFKDFGMNVDIKDMDKEAKNEICV